LTLYPYLITVFNSSVKYNPIHEPRGCNVSFSILNGSKGIIKLSGVVILASANPKTSSNLILIPSISFKKFYWHWITHCFRI